MKHVFIGLLAVAVVCCVGSLYAGHTDYHCADCHQPHRAFDPNDDPADYGVPLWNGMYVRDGIPTFTKYTGSPDFQALNLTFTGQPTGASKLCIGCHDGSYSHVTADHTFGVDDLANSHPISLNYEEARTNGAKLKDPASLSGYGGTVASDMLDENGDIQCVSCHDIHVQGGEGALIGGSDAWDAGNGRGLTLCKACHDK